MMAENGFDSRIRLDLYDTEGRLYTTKSPKRR
jgi:hypothetical protein